MENFSPDQNMTPAPIYKTAANKKNTWIFITIIIIAFLILLTMVYLSLNRTRQGVMEPVAANNPSALSPSPTPTPMPFYEITIPYLREREYRSSLGSLQKAYENQSYTAYVTSYDSDGLRINALLTQPKLETPLVGWPAIIFVHGYITPSSYQTTQNYSDYVDFLGRNGFVVFKIDLRGHGISEGEPGGAYYSSDYIIDTLNAYAALQEASFVNPARIGLWGHSMAGNVVMRSFAARPDIPAVVILAGAVYSYTDFREYRISDASYQPPDMSSERVRKRQQLIDIHGQPSLDSIFWQQVAPTSFLSDLKGAVQIHHAVNDPVVSIEYSRNLVALLNGAGVNHEFYEYSSGGHNLTDASFNQSMQRTVDFFKDNLK